MTMLKIGMINRHTIKHIDQQIMAKLEELGEELGLSITINGGSFGSASYSPKLEIKLIDEATGQVKTDPYFKALCDTYGLDPSITSYDGYRITGYKSSRPKFPWEITDRNGGIRKATQSWVMLRFKKGSPSHAAPTAPVMPTMNQVLNANRTGHSYTSEF